MIGLPAGSGWLVFGVVGWLVGSGLLTVVGCAGWLRLVQVGSGWFGLAQVGAGWFWLLQLDPGWLTDWIVD